MSDAEWVVLRTHPAGAAVGPIDAAGMDMLRLEQELTAAGIPVGWDPFRPGEGFQSFYMNVAWPRPLRMLVREQDLEAAREIESGVFGEGDKAT